MSKSKIDWLNGGDTINPFAGCRNGCDFCYARKMAHRLAHMDGTVYQKVLWATSGEDPETGIAYGDGNSFAPAVHLDVLQREQGRLCRAKTPRRVFVGSMGDICYDGLAVTFAADGSLMPMSTWWPTLGLQNRIAQFARFLLDCGTQHTILLLTKRPNLLARYVQWSTNVHLGVSITGNSDAHRIDELHRFYGSSGANEPWNECKPGVLWASVEPLLDPDFDPECLAGLDWIVVGAQTGPGVPKPTPLILQAARRVVGWCLKNNVPCFVKDNLRRSDNWLGWPREYPNFVQPQGIV